MGDGYLGRYRLDELLGSGGSAEVWRAHDTVADRTVALKVLAPVLTADPEYRRRFEREARAASLLHGPHVVAVHTYGELEGRLFIDSEFVDGLDIEALLEWEGPMAPDAAVDLIAQIATALDEAHAAGLIHRDVKPQNIIVAPDDIAYLIDFGTALQDGQTAITQAGMLVGTPAYMAPERFDGTVSTRSDIYSLACVLYECLTGERPFRLRNPAQLMRAHLERTPEPPSTLAPAVPAALDAVIARGLAKNPGERYATAGEFAAAARAALTGDGATVVIPALPAELRTALRAARSEPGTDTRTIALPTNPRLAASPALAAAPPRRQWTERRALTAAGLLIAVAAVAIGTAWFTGRTAESEPDRERIPATFNARTQLPQTIPPTTAQPVEQPPETTDAPPPEEPVVPETAAPALPPWTVPTLPPLPWTIPAIPLPVPKPGGGKHPDHPRGPR
ncbi:hypothetical protein JMUB6875_50880 [Nocardia sp. JMUB6875]